MYDTHTATQNKLLTACPLFFLLGILPHLTAPTLYLLGPNHSLSLNLNFTFSEVSFITLHYMFS